MTKKTKIKNEAKQSAILLIAKGLKTVFPPTEKSSSPNF